MDIETNTNSPPASAPENPEPSVVTLLSAPFHAVTLRGAVDHIVRCARRGRGGWVLTPNLDILRRLTVEPEFVNLVEGTTLRLADGQILVWASRLRRAPLPERVAGSDLIWALGEGAAAAGLSVFLLGGNPGAAEGAAKVLLERNPTIRIAGVECPPFGFENDPAYVPALADKLRAVNPDVVCVGLGCPKQERLIVQLRRVLPGAWFLGLGVTFSFVSGEISRAPMWVRRIGAEWLHRLIQEPRRLAKRYLVDGLPFAGRLLIASAWDGVTGRGRREWSAANQGRSGA